MDETIRDYVKRRVRWGYGTAGAGWILLMVFGVVLHRTRTFEATQVIGYVGALAVTLTGVILITSVKCPKCSARLGQVAFGAAYQWGWRRKVNFCPYCGVNLDTPRQQQANPIS